MEVISCNAIFMENRTEVNKSRENCIHVGASRAHHLIFRINAVQCFSVLAESGGTFP